MMIAHLPAGYLALRAWPVALERRVFIAGLLGAVAPDLDMVWFLFVDQGAHHHHSYLTHRPALWLGVLIVTLLVGRWIHPAWKQMGIALSACALLHLGLDSIVGQIAWGWPLSDVAAPWAPILRSQSDAKEPGLSMCCPRAYTGDGGCNDREMGNGNARITSGTRR